MLATGLMASAIVASPDSSLLSTTRAVMVCVPTPSTDVENDVPEPMKPWMLDAHCSCAPIAPSSASVALPVKDTEVPAVNVAPFDGEVITTTGGVMGVPLTMLVMAR